MISLQQYLAAPLDIEFNPDIDTPLILKRFEKLLSFESKLYFIKVSYVKKLVFTLVSEGKFKDFKFNVKRKFKPEAYMYDGGEINISYGIFLHTTAPVFLTVLCHEIAHIWLSQREDYGDIKELNRQFKKEFSDGVNSPVEVWARIVQTKILEKIISVLQGKKREKLLKCLDGEREKLKILESGIVALKGNS